LTPSPEIPEHQPARISVVIVSLNRVEQLRQSLEMLNDAFQVIVVDSGSTDGAASLDEEFPWVRYSRLPKNFGFTKALNIGLRSTEGEYILCLHDDARIAADAVTQLADFLESRPEVGAVCPLLTDVSGDPIPQARPLPAPADPDPALRLPGDADEIVTGCVSGAAIMFRAFFLRALRQVDERYGTYGSAIEICSQIKRAGKKIVILKAATAIHESLPSPVPEGMLEGDRAAGTAAFLGKHYGFMASLLYRIKTALGALFTFRFSVLAGVLSGQKIDGGA
jgi:N-acetylglucosaminyl-diphospho-decaprenol L-rhamnosyltransferase